MNESNSNNRYRELIYQLVFNVVLFLTFSIDSHHSEFRPSDIGFFLFYIIVATIVNYVLLPQFFYKKKLISFWGGVIVLLTITYLAEELVLEPLLIGGKRADHVSNIFYTLLGIIPTLFMMVMFKVVLDFIRKQREVDELKSLIKEGELRFLKSQIQPHFLFNNLNNLYSYAIEQSSKTPEIILELSAVLRHMLYDCREDFIPLSKEIDHLKHYTSLSKLQIETRGRVEFQEELESDKFKIAPLILTVFVENAFKHSAASLIDDIEIEINVRANKEGMLNFCCINNFSSEVNYNDLREGIGLENVQKRLKLLYPDRHNLEIRKEDENFKVELSIDLSDKS